MATVTVGTIGGTMTSSQLKTALDNALGVDLTRQGGATSRTYRCVDNLNIQGTVDAEGFTFICANLKTVTFHGSSASPGILKTTTYVDGVAYLPIRIVYEGETPFGEHDVTQETQGLFRNCGADIGKLEIICTGDGGNYFGMNFLTVQKVIIKDLSINNQNTSGGLYTNFNLTHAQSYVRISLLRNSTIRLSTATLDFGFIGTDGWAYGEGGDQFIKLLCPNNTRIVGFSPKFLNSSGALQLASNNIGDATNRFFKDSSVDPSRITIYPAGNDNVSAEIERTFIYKPQTPTGGILADIATRVKSARVITGNAGVTAGDTILNNSIINTNDNQTFRVWKGFNPSAGVYTLPTKIIDDSNVTVHYRRADLIEGIVNITGYQGQASVVSTMGIDTDFTGTIAQSSAITGISFVYNNVANTVAVTINGTATLQDVNNYWKYWSSLPAQMGLNLVPQNLIQVIGDTLEITGSITVNSALTGTPKIAKLHVTNSLFTTAINNIEIVGNVIQDTPTNLINVKINGKLTYNTNTNATITITHTYIRTIENLGTGIITINKVNSSIDDYVDAEINFIDSTISVIGADTITIHPTARDRDLNENISETFTTSFNFKYGSVVNGTTMSTKLYLRCVAGGTPFNFDKTIIKGDNVVNLGIVAQLSSLTSKIELTATTEQLRKVNENVIDAGVLIPASKRF